MDDEQLRNIAQLLVKTAIEKAVDKVMMEKKEMDSLDQGVDDIVELTIGRSVTAIRKGQSSPNDNMMEEMFDLDKTLVTETTEVATGETGSKLIEIKDEQIKLSVEGSDNQPRVIISDPIKDDKPTELRKGHVGTTHRHFSNTSCNKTSGRTHGSTSGKKNILELLFDRIFKRSKRGVKESYTTTTDESTNTEGKKKSSSKAHNKRDWIRKHLMCCFVRQTATVEPLVD